MTLLPPTPELTILAQIIQLAIAPVFLLAGLGSFLNVCVGRLARIVDRTRQLVAFLTGYRVGTPIALLFIAAMASTGAGFAIFLFETRLATKTVHVHSHILEHRADEDEAEQ